jgi:hypothetical protein
VISAINDRVLNEYFVSIDIPLTGVFSDVDGDALTYNAVSSEPGVVMVSVTGSTLTLIEAGLGTSTITVTASDGTLSVEDVFTVTVSDVVTLPPGWEINPPDYANDGQVTAKVYIDGTAVEAGYLAAFYGEECRGIADTAYFAPLDHYVFALRYYSNSSGTEDLEFRYYDPFQDRIYNMDTIVVFVSNMVIGDAEEPVTMHNCTDFNKSFTAGWNWFSVNKTLDDMSVGTLLSACVSPGDYIKDQTQSSMYYDGFGWWGDLITIDPKVLYKINLDNPCGINICGLPVDLNNNSIDVTSGWNWIGFLPQTPMPISDALASLPLEVDDYIKNHLVSSLYYEGFGWWGDLENLSPGEGYMIRLANPGTLTFPSESGLKSAYFTPLSNVPDKDLGRFEFNGSVTAGIMLNGTISGTENDTLFAYVGDSLRGTAKGIWFEPSGTYLFPIMIHSNKSEGEIVEFRYLNSKTNEIIKCSETIIFKKDMIVANALNPYLLNIKSVSQLAGEGENIKYLTIYPNPFADHISIQYMVPQAGHVSITVLDSFGRLIKLLVDQYQISDNYKISWEADQNPEGIYFIKIKIGDKQEVQKITLIR